MNVAIHGLIAFCGAIALGMAAAAGDAAPRSNGMPLTDSRLLQTATTLAASTTLHAEAVGKALGIELSLDGAVSNRFFAVYKGHAAARDAVEMVELRTPVGDKAERGSIVHMMLKPSTLLTARQVIEVCGAPDILRVPPPQAAAGGAVIYVYKNRKARGELRFALGPPPTEALLSVTIDGTE